MSKSIDFCKQRAKESDFDFLPGTQFNEVNSLEVLETICNNEEIISQTAEDGTKIFKYVKIIYDPDADFDYFTHARCRNDGTLLFAYENILNIFYKLICRGTACITKIPDDFRDNYKKYNFIYTIGNIVTTTEHSKEFSTEEKPWMLQRDTAMLPIKFDVELRDIEIDSEDKG